jgi:uncharacterized protein (TIGR03067 family)
MKTKLAFIGAAMLAAACFARADGAGPLDPTVAADQPKGAPTNAHAKPAQPTPQPAKTDRERMVGNWFIINDDSRRKGEMWVITDDSILMYANYGGLNAYHYAHQLDASKDPKQIDITVSRVNGQAVGLIKGIYVLEGDELRLCLGEMGKDRPAAFPDKPKAGELLVLRRASSGAVPPAANDAGPPAAKGVGQPLVKGAGPPTATVSAPPPPANAGPPAPRDAVPEQKALTPEEAIQQRPKEKVVTVQFKVTAVQDESQSPGTGFGVGFILLKDGGNFSVRLVPPAMYTLMRLDIDPVKHFTGRVVRVTGLVQPVPQIRQAEGPCWIDVNDLEHLAVLRQ